MDDTLKVLKNLATDIAKQQAHRKANHYREGSLVHELNADAITEADAQLKALSSAIAAVEENTRLREQNAWLKRALEPFAFPDLTIGPDDDYEDTISLDIPFGDIRRARAELKEE